MPERVAAALYMFGMLRSMGDFGDHGGLTSTVAPHSGSPAIDAADPTACPEVDQRGVPRPSGQGCDVGAFEWSGLNTLLVTRGHGTRLTIAYAGEPRMDYAFETSRDLTSWTLGAIHRADALGYVTFDWPTASEADAFRFLRVSTPSPSHPATLGVDGSGTGY